jgi:hypothetical protein
MRQLRHATPGFTLSTYAMAMDLADGEQDRTDAEPAEPEGAGRLEAKTPRLAGPSGADELSAY